MNQFQKEVKRALLGEVFWTNLVKIVELLNSTQPYEAEISYELPGITNIGDAFVSLDILAGVDNNDKFNIELNLVITGVEVDESTDTFHLEVLLVEDVLARRIKLSPRFGI
jgi:hypothetical protein